MFKGFGVAYRATLFVLALVFLVVYLGMFVAHTGNSLIGTIKFYLFSYRQIYIVTDMGENHRVTHFVMDYISKQAGKKYKHKLVNFAECAQIADCKSKPGVIFSQNPGPVYAFLDKGILTPNSHISEIILQSNSSIDRGVMILRGNSEQEIYYYAIGKSAPLGALLTNMSVSIINVINSPA